ncbi:HEAT repeat domain-containing protein [Chamaesiphon minutus]|uniref:HEAT repeat-containing protein n=1 Tax=Chamaesiphon minutus (strain ATCC 27169 / PCC 6605) TaxID=1173020 RepID=K9UC56_CHAP6|nr:HEAT repeat domain-containing protein [Chamaesiphon minutus]AFY92021.1 HEAT repeat-containing protein [Chamaesiphon minutus PCC 6605]
MSSIDLDRAILAASGANNQRWSIVIDCLQGLSVDRLHANQTALDLALQVLSQGDFEQQWEIAKLIPKLGEIAIQPLLDSINDPDIDLEDRWFAARILGAFPRAEVVTALVAIIQADEDPELSAIATAALAKIGTPAIAAVTELILQSRTDESIANRRLAATILAQIRHSQTIEPLLQIIDDPDPQIRTIVVEALSSFHDLRIPSLLLAKLTDPIASVRKAAVVALSCREDVASPLDLLYHLRPLLFDLDLTVCQATALGLARLTAPEAVTVLAEVLSSSRTPDDLKRATILSLGWIGTRTAIDSLIAALYTTTLDLLPEIITAIGKTEPEQIYASDRLVTYLNGNDLTPIVKQEIAAALGNLGNKNTVPDLVKLLGDPDDRVKLHTITAISKLSPSVPHEITQLIDRERGRSLADSELQIGVRMCLDRYADPDAISSSSPPNSERLDNLSG